MKVWQSFISTRLLFLPRQFGKLFFSQSNSDIVNLLTPLGGLLILILAPLLIFVLYPAGNCWLQTSRHWTLTHCKSSLPESQLTTMSFFAGSSFPPSNSGRVTILEADDDLPERVAYLEWRQTKIPHANTDTWMNLVLQLPVKDNENGCKRNCLAQLRWRFQKGRSLYMYIVQYMSNRSGYLLSSIHFRRGLIMT